MIVLACVTGVATRFTAHSGGRADVEMWLFSDNQRRTLAGIGMPPGTLSPIEQFEQSTGLTTDIKHVQFRALNTRLSTLFLGNVRGPEVPDVVAIEISSVGRFFAPPVDQIGFLPLNDLIKRHGWSGSLIESRLAAWSKDGVIFGIPCDVHAVMIAYNDKLFHSAGVDLAASKTWDEFIDNCLAAQRRWRDEGITNRWALELPQNNPGLLVTMLLQRGVNLIDADGQLRMTDPLVLDTLVTYCELVAGSRRISAQPSEGNQVYSIDLNSGMLGAMIAPDWRVKYIRDLTPDQAGKMRVMPLPRWPDSPYRTSTWGGSAIAIPRNASNPEQSWRLIEMLVFSEAAMPGPNIYTLPAVRTLWEKDPWRNDPDPYYSGQYVRRLIAELAEEVPARHVSPASTFAEAALGQVLVSAIGRLRDRGGSDPNFREYCASQLAEAERLVRARVAHAERSQ